MEELKAKVKYFIKNSDKVVESLKKLKDLKNIPELIKNVSLVGTVVMDTIILVELAATEVEGLKSEEKLATAVSIIDDALDFPWYLELFDGPLLKLIISLGVDYMNKTRGKDWNLDKEREKLAQGKAFIEGLLS